MAPYVIIGIVAFVICRKLATNITTGIEQDNAVREAKRIIRMDEIKEGRI